MVDDREADGTSLIAELKERAKELNCLYRVEELLGNPDLQFPDLLQAVVDVLPAGWQFSEACEAQISVEGIERQTSGFEPTPWMLESPITVQEETIGHVTVAYHATAALDVAAAFLKEEVKLLGTVADRIGHHVLHRRLKSVFSEKTTRRRREWQVALDLLRKTDARLLEHMARRLLNSLARTGVASAAEALRRHRPRDREDFANRPSDDDARYDADALIDDAFEVAQEQLTDDQILTRVQKLIQKAKVASLARPITDERSSLGDACDALARLSSLPSKDSKLRGPMATSVKMGLLGRFFSEQRSFLNRAKGNVEVEDFFQFPGRVVLVPGSRGKLGGKAAGLFLAGCVVTRAAHEDPELEGVRTPLSWYLPSDALNAFLQYNDLEDLRLQKYRTPTEIVQDYPRIVQLMRDSRFPRDLVQGLAAALDGLGEVPLVVRSSSLLEDQAGAAFSGKYLSLFLGNQGDREQRLAALLGAVAEVYASTFCPDVIEYRGERGLLDLNEEMGILIQQVVGKRLGKYFLPAFAGVAFSRNEFRWSPRISREDGLVRLVPGLGTRAVDRLADDYPVLVAPGKPMLRVNSNTDEVMRYAPKKLDLINLDTGGFETLAFTDLVREIGEDYPNIKQIVSINRNGILHRPMGLATDYRKASMVVTFDGLIAASPFLGTIKKLLTLLEGQLGGPVDIEFASDGDHLYLLQCRPQSHVVDDAAVAIPAEISPEDLVFSANRFVSNGQIPDITHLVYVDPEGYDGLVERDSVLKIRESIGQLNKRLPRRQFILMGPGRWGSRGDIKLGVPVTYSEINNTAMLIEIARRKGDYQPDLSFGTHFFQDLVEASIRYLPLYPDDPGSVLNVDFIRTAPNALEQIVPEAASVADVVRVIDIPAAANHRVLRLLANAEAELAVGILVDRSEPVQLAGSAAPTDRAPDEHSIWRIRMAKELASRVDPARFGVVAVYVIGSTMNETAGPASDIDLVIHVRNDPERQAALESWLDGWNHSLAVSNLLRTGHKTAALLDLHFVTDSDIEQQTSFAVMIGTPRAQELPILR